MKLNTSSYRSFSFRLITVMTLVLGAASAACSGDDSSSSGGTTNTNTNTSALGPNCTKYIETCCPALMAKAGQPTTTCDTAKSGYSSSYSSATATQKEAIENTCSQANANGKTMGVSGC